MKRNTHAFTGRRLKVKEVNLHEDLPRSEAISQFVSIHRWTDRSDID